MNTPENPEFAPQHVPVMKRKHISLDLKNLVAKRLDFDECEHHDIGCGPFFQTPAPSLDIDDGVKEKVDADEAV